MLDTEEWRSGDHHYFSTITNYTTRVFSPFSSHVFLAHILDKLALLVISACGFNMRLGWHEHGSSDGLSSPIDEAVVTVSSTIIERLNFEWVFCLPIEG